MADFQDLVVIQTTEKQVTNYASYLREIISTSVHSTRLHQKPLTTVFWSKKKLSIRYLASSLALFSKNWSCHLLASLDLQFHCSVKGERMVVKLQKTSKQPNSGTFWLILFLHQHFSAMKNTKIRTQLCQPCLLFVRKPEYLSQSFLQ